MAPGTALAPVRPAPYTQVAVARVAEVGTNSSMEAEGKPQDGQRLAPPSRSRPVLPRR